MPFGITAGPDGNLWFTEFSGNQVGKVTPSGTFTEYPIPTSSSAPNGITTGPDGNLWFTESDAGKIGTVTPAGTLTEYAVGPHGLPGDIVTGPDGNLWFTEPTEDGNLIGSVTPTGTVTAYLIPMTAGVTVSFPFGIAAAPDGNLWFTYPQKSFHAGQAVGRVGYVTTGGAFTTYAIPTANSGGPDTFTVGPDGNLWFTELDANQIGRVTPSGAVTEYAIPTSDSRPYGITTGSDGNLWFTEFGAGAIARLVPSGAGPLCGAAPMAGCRTSTVSQAGSVSLRRGVYSSDDDELNWQWLRGAATSMADFGTPDTATDYQLCIYDGTASIIGDAFVPAGGTCGGKACWSPTGQGFRYKNRDRRPEGVESILLREGPDGGAVITLKGRGRNLTMPAVMPLSQPVKVQLLNSDGVCWEATYGAPALQNSTRQFKDKAD
jgi:streptogramin lyase